MKFSVSTTVLALAALATAAPSTQANLLRRQGATSNELQSSSGCKAVSFIMARGSTEGGNMGNIVGGPLCKALKDAASGGVACQGIGGDYKAELAPNFQPKGTTEASIKEGVKTVMAAMMNCPQARVVMAGYSQGAALVSAAIQTMPPDQQARIDAVVLFGYTKNQQLNGMIPGYPQDKLKVFCRDDDGVCAGQLDVTQGHLAYGRDGTVDMGASFMMSKVQSGGK